MRPSNHTSPCPGPHDLILVTLDGPRATSKELETANLEAEKEEEKNRLRFVGEGVIVMWHASWRDA